VRILGLLRVCAKSIQMEDCLVAADQPTATPNGQLPHAKGVDSENIGGFYFNPEHCLIEKNSFYRINPILYNERVSHHPTAPD